MLLLSLEVLADEDPPLRPIRSRHGDRTFESFAESCAEQLVGKVGRLYHGQTYQSRADWRHQELERARRQLKALKQRSDQEWDLLAERTFARERRYYDHEVLQRAADRQDLTQLLERAKAWVPPSENHADLKAYMISQLQESLDALEREADRFPVPERHSGAFWKEQMLEHARIEIRSKIQLRRDGYEGAAEAAAIAEWWAVLRNDLTPPAPPRKRRGRPPRSALPQ